MNLHLQLVKDDVRKRWRAQVSGFESAFWECLVEGREHLKRVLVLGLRRADPFLDKQPEKRWHPADILAPKVGTQLVSCEG